LCHVNQQPILPESRPKGNVRRAMSGQDSESLPSLTRVALQTVKLQQTETFAGLMQVDSILLARPELNDSRAPVIIA
jgi:hypothetical protein